MALLCLALVWLGLLCFICSFTLLKEFCFISAFLQKKKKKIHKTKIGTVTTLYFHIIVNKQNRLRERNDEGCECNEIFIQTDKIGLNYWTTEHMFSKNISILHITVRSRRTELHVMIRTERVNGQASERFIQINLEYWT